MDDLFSASTRERSFQNAPLAVRMRPNSLDEYVGQQKAVGKGSWLRAAIEHDVLSSVILYGPAGTGKTTLALLPAAMAGGLAGFLVYNFHPAKVFMGDTGSLFMSGMVIALAFGTGLPFFVVLFGIIYVIEIGSVVLQRCYFKLTHGKRIFKMTPIHHHFELCGWKEEKIVFVFTAITLVMCVLAYLGVMNRY